MRILIIEDDQEIARYLRKGLSEAGHTVEHADNGRDGLYLATGESFDAIILDRLLPQMDGLTVLTALRATGASIPVLILSALSQVDDRIKGLRAGGDDYLVKPFPLAELLARVRALLRRHFVKKSPQMRVGDLELDPMRRTVQRGGRAVELTALEYRLLEYLFYRSGEVVSRTAIWDHVFEDSTGGSSNAVDVYIGYLRKKLNTGNLPDLIHTRRGQGYILEEPTP